MFDTIKSFFSATWDKMKAFFLYSKTIFLARITAISGLVMSAVGLMDWSPLFNYLGLDTGFSTKQIFWTGAIVFIKGVIDEIARRVKPNADLGSKAS